MPDQSPAPAAGAPVCTPEELAARQRGFAMWFYRPDRTPRTRAERLWYLRLGASLCAATGTHEATLTPEQTDEALLSLWNGTPVAVPKRKRRKTAHTAQ